MNQAEAARDQSAPDDDILTTQEVADELRVARVTVSKWLAEGKLKGYRVGALWRVRRSDLEEFVQSGSNESADD